MANGATYRRGSVFGALLLIGIGFLFLYANVNSEFNPWTLLARYWPVLIIFWGLSRLADYFILRNTDQAAAVTRIGAGDIIGLIFILIFGTIFTQIVRLPLDPNFPFRFGGGDFPCLFGQEQEFTEQLEQAWTPADRLDLSNLRGDVTVTAAAAPQLRISIRKKFCAPNQADAESLNQNVQAKLERTIGDLGVQSGLIAKNSSEVDELKRRGERNYYEFDVKRSKQYVRVGTISVRLNKTDAKRQKYTVTLLANDKAIEKKDKTLLEPVQFYLQGTRHLLELVVYDVQKDRIVGYLSTPKELAQAR